MMHLSGQSLQCKVKLYLKSQTFLKLVLFCHVGFKISPPKSTAYLLFSAANVRVMERDLKQVAAIFT